MQKFVTRMLIEIVLRKLSVGLKSEVAHERRCQDSQSSRRSLRKIHDARVGVLLRGWILNAGYHMARLGRRCFPQRLQCTRRGSEAAERPSSKGADRARALLLGCH